MRHTLLLRDYWIQRDKSWRTALQGETSWVCSVCCSPSSVRVVVEDFPLSKGKCLSAPRLEVNWWGDHVASLVSIISGPHSDIPTLTLRRMIMFAGHETTLKVVGILSLFVIFLNAILINHSVDLWTLGVGQAPWFPEEIACGDWWNTGESQGERWCWVLGQQFQEYVTFGGLYEGPPTSFDSISTRGWNSLGPRIGIIEGLPHWSRNVADSYRRWRPTSHETDCWQIREGIHQITNS